MRPKIQVACGGTDEHQIPEVCKLADDKAKHVARVSGWRPRHEDPKWHVKEIPEPLVACGSA